MKKEKRQEALKKLRSLPSPLKNKLDQQLTQALLATPAYREARVVASYLSMEHEFDTQAFIQQALADGKSLLIPKTYKGGRMIFVVYDPADLEKSSFGLLEPRSQLEVAKTEIDLIHVPGLLFNREGYRIGYGGGYYDRYLADFEGATISTIYPLQLADFEASQHDVAVKEVLLAQES
ncbi:5-formyltetrahydrofolate cyclo-ligase [Streptococcus oricebi]|uniref:5-formyltetrahydrofolate cyclo-ligase n=1 Tax=Streptococcus oricebi TaxID=1547447 RepID=A0ABS5B4R5_9STRE|nr:5-formyltetrahydrofolate cyclo-ligase [Streptococcus oricebi]MBP2623827.1 5-formyltetrahydrofolate cyclo-ligase [Streptococcus oricebi]